MDQIIFVFKVYTLYTHGPPFHSMCCVACLKHSSLFSPSTKHTLAAQLVTSSRKPSLPSRYPTGARAHRILRARVLCFVLCLSCTDLLPHALCTCHPFCPLSQAPSKKVISLGSFLYAHLPPELICGVRGGFACRWACS